MFVHGRDAAAGRSNAASVVLQRRDDDAARVELLGEELSQLVVHAEQLGRRGLSDHHLELVPLEVAAQVDRCRSAKSVRQ